SEKSGEKTKREDETQKRQDEAPAEASAEKKPPEKTTPEKKTPVKAEEKADLRFMVTLPDRFSESEDFVLLKQSGANYDVSVQVEPTIWIFAVGMTLTLGLFVMFWMWLRR